MFTKSFVFTRKYLKIAEILYGKLGKFAIKKIVAIMRLHTTACYNIAIMEIMQCLQATDKLLQRTRNRLPNTASSSVIAS